MQKKVKILKKFLKKTQKKLFFCVKIIFFSGKKIFFFLKSKKKIFWKKIFLEQNKILCFRLTKFIENIKILEKLGKNRENREISPILEISKNRGVGPTISLKFRGNSENFFCQFYFFLGCSKEIQKNWSETNLYWFPSKNGYIFCSLRTEKKLKKFPERKSSEIFEFRPSHF